MIIVVGCAVKGRGQFIVVHIAIDGFQIVGSYHIVTVFVDNGACEFIVRFLVGCNLLFQFFFLGFVFCLPGSYEKAIEFIRKKVRRR